MRWSNVASNTYNNIMAKLDPNNNIKTYGLEDASRVSKTYSLDGEKVTLLVLDNLETLHLTGKTFHTCVIAFVFCKSGYSEFIINGTKHCLKERGLFVNLSDIMVSEVFMSEDFTATAMVVTHDFLQESVLSMMHLWPYLIYVMEHPILQLGEVETRRIRLNYRLMIERLSEEEHAFRREATIANLQACYLDVCDFLKRRASRNMDIQTRAYGIFDQFMHLVASEYVQHRDVQWYADKLTLTPKYLSEVVKQVSGRTASAWITNFVITELKSLLRNSDLSIKEIAVEMNFANQSFLGKYFKNVVGISPQEYRVAKE